MLTLFSRVLGLCIGTLVIVFGTYGTSNGSLYFGGTIYAIYALPFLLVLVSLLLFFDLLRDSRISVYPFISLEGQVLLTILFLTAVSTLRLPQYLWTSLFTVALSVVMVAFLVNRMRSEAEFKALFSFYQSLIYFTAVLALCSGVYSMFVGSIVAGPLLIEYNPLFWRMNAWFNASTMLGLFFSHAILSAYYFLLRARTKAAAGFHVAAMVGLAVGLALAGGRTGAVTCLLSFTALALLRVKLTPFRLLCLGAFAGGLAGLATYLVYEYGESVYLVRRFLDEPDTFGGRLGFLTDALQVMETSTVDQLLFGFGVNGVRDILKWDNSPHSGMIRIWLEHGLLTISMYFLLNAIMLRRLATDLRRRDSLDAERQVVFLMLLTFFVAEAIVIQMLGVDLFYALFLAAFSFYLGLRRIGRKRSTEFGLRGRFAPAPSTSVDLRTLPS